jgi:hypothetical protein
VSVDSRFPYFRDYKLDLSTIGNKITFPCHEYSGFSIEFKQGGSGLISVSQTNDNPDEIVNPQWFSISGYDASLDSTFNTIGSPSLVDFPAVGAWAKIEVVSSVALTGTIRVFLKSSRAITATHIIPSSSPLPVEAIQDDKTTRLQDNGTYTFIGKAEPGSLESDPVWQIQRLTNATTTILYADGDSNFNNIWTNYLSLSYS